MTMTCRQVDVAGGTSNRSDATRQRSPTDRRRTRGAVATTIGVALSGDDTTFAWVRPPLLTTGSTEIDTDYTTSRNA